MVALDVYVNETTRHADVILPGADAARARALRPRALPARRAQRGQLHAGGSLEPGMPQEWETLLRLAGDRDRPGRATPTSRRSTTSSPPSSRGAGRRRRRAAGRGAPRTGPARLLDLLLRAGPYDLTLADLEAAPHGIDLGPLQPRLPGVLRTPSGQIELAPEPIVADVPRLRAALDRAAQRRLVLIGRRQLRSNNSWMHNLAPLVKGRSAARCTCTPTTPRASGSTTASPRACARARARSRARRGDRRGHARRRLDPARLGPRRDGVRMGVAAERTRA